MRSSFRAAAVAVLATGVAAIPCNQNVLCAGNALAILQGTALQCPTNGAISATLGTAIAGSANPAGDPSQAACQAACDLQNAATAGTCQGIYYGNIVTDPINTAPKCYTLDQTAVDSVVTGLGSTSAPVGNGFVSIQCDAVAPTGSSAGTSAASSAASSAGSSAAATSASAVTSDTAIATSASATVSGASSSISSASSSSASASASAGASFPICPQDAGKTFSAQSGAGFSTFRVVCGAGTIGKRSYPAAIEKRQVAGAPLNAFGICITACANSATCASVLFNPLNGACALFDCVITVGPGLSGAVRLTNPGGTPFSAAACPANQPTTVPPQNNNGTVINLNLNIDIDVNVEVLAGELEGLPYTQFCRTGKCDECTICKKKPVNECSVCEKKGKEPPFKPSKEYCPPGLPGKPGFPGTCTECEKKDYYPEPAKPDYHPEPAKPDYHPAKPDYDNKGKPAKSDYDNKGYPADDSKKGKYTGPYSNDAAGLNAMGALIGGAFALAFALA